MDWVVMVAVGLSTSLSKDRFDLISYMCAPETCPVFLRVLRSTISLTETESAQHCLEVFFVIGNSHSNGHATSFEALDLKGVFRRLCALEVVKPIFSF